METKDFRGLWTALITPFEQGDGIGNKIDYKALERILNLQIDAGVDGVLLLGTTGERPTLTEEEEIELIKFSVNILKGKTKIMVNAGTYSTLDSVKTITYLEEINGIDCYLIVNPYYNKPTQTGLKKHFVASAKKTLKPVFIYNIVGRTGVNLETETLLEIIEEAPNVVGVKEASGNLEQMKDVIEKTSDNFLVLSGDDGMTYDLTNCGGDGVVSVASNCIPRKMKNFVDNCLEKKEEAMKQNEYLQEFFKKLFIQTNPLPAKTFLANKGIIKEEFRLPICRMDNKQREEFLNFVKENGF